MLNIDSTNWIWSKNKLVCSDHFQQSDYIILGNKKQLKNSAVPSLKLGYTAQHLALPSTSKGSVNISLSSSSSSQLTPIRIDGDKQNIKKRALKRKKR